MAGLFSQLYWPKLLKYLPRLLLHAFNDKYISVCVCVFSLGFHCCLPGTFQPQSSLASFRHKRKIILKTGLLRYEQTLPCVLFSPVFIIAAKAAETEAENHVGSQARGGGVCKSLRHNGTHCVAGAPTSQENFMPFVSIVLVFMPEILLFSGTI